LAIVLRPLIYNDNLLAKLLSLAMIQHISRGETVGLPHSFNLATQLPIWLQVGWEKGWNFTKPTCVCTQIVQSAYMSIEAKDNVFLLLQKGQKPRPNCCA